MAECAWERHRPLLRDSLMGGEWMSLLLLGDSVTFSQARNAILLSDRRSIQSNGSRVS